MTWILKWTEYLISTRNYTASTGGKELRYIACVDLLSNILSRSQSLLDFLNIVKENRNQSRTVESISFISWYESSQFYMCSTVTFYTKQKGGSVTQGLDQLITCVCKLAHMCNLGWLQFWKEGYNFWNKLYVAKYWSWCQIGSHIIYKFSFSSVWYEMICMDPNRKFSFLHQPMLLLSHYACR